MQLPTLARSVPICTKQRQATNYIHLPQKIRSLSTLCVSSETRVRHLYYKRYLKQTYTLSTKKRRASLTPGHPADRKVHEFLNLVPETTEAIRGECIEARQTIEASQIFTVCTKITLRLSQYRTGIHARSAGLTLGDLH